MKIAQIVSTYPPYYGGMGNVVFQTASALDALGHEVVVFTPGYYEKREVKKPLDKPTPKHAPDLQAQIDFAKRLKPSLSYGNAARLPTIRKELSEFDIVHLHYPFFGTAGMIKDFKLKNPAVPLVITYHMDTRALGWKGLVFKYYARYAMPKILRVADRLLVSSFDYLESSDAAQIYQNNPSLWQELPFGVDVERFKPRPKPEALFARHKLDINTPTIVFVGGMDSAHYFKGVPVLLKALLLAKQQDTPVQAVLVGDGNLRADFENRAVAYGLKDWVKFAGRVSDDELPYYYNTGDLFVLPSTTSGEAFGMVLLEAMASGLPVVASDLPGVRTVASAGGSVVPPNDYISLSQAIVGYFSDNTIHSEWQSQVRQLAEEQYAWPVIAERLEKIYHALVG